ncbi:DinB family protein [Flavobacteriaceae bacterium 3-367]
MKYFKYYLPMFVLLLGCGRSGPEEDQNKWWTESERQLIVSELQRTTNELQAVLEDITEVQWNFREDPARWSIAQIVEHLEMQNQLHYRELSVVSKAPQYLQYRSITQGKDTFFTKYGTDPKPGKAQWFLEPLGRFCSINDGRSAFLRARQELTQLVETTPIDFRKQFTFRAPVEGKELKDIKIGQVRDLHQLLLTGIAHTDRHLNQIRKIKHHQEYPKD